MTKPTTILFLFVLCTYATSAQQLSEVDSLEQALNTATNNTERIDILLQLSKKYRYVDLDKNLQYAQQAKDLAITMHDTASLVQSMNDIGTVYEFQGELDSALSLYNEALTISEKVSDDRATAVSLLHIGGVYKKKSYYTLALEYFLESLKLCEVLGLQQGIAANLGNVGLVYIELSEYEKALEHSFKALQLSEKLEDKYLMSIQLNNIGLIYGTQKKFDESLEYHFKSYELKQAINNRQGMAYSLNNIGKVYLLQKKFDDAILYLNQSLMVNQGLDEDLLTITYENLSNTYLGKNELKKAEEFAVKSLQLSREIGSKLGEKEGLATLSRIYASRGNYQKAYTYEQQMSAVKDSIFNAEKSRQIAEMQTLYETEKKEKELALQAQQIALLERDRKIETLQRNILLTSLILIALLAFLVYKYQRMRFRKNQQLLKTQQTLTLVELENVKLKEQELRQELEYKNKELTSYTINFIQKNELMEELKESISQLKESSDAAVSKKLNSLNRLVDSSFNIDKDWEDFRLHFEQVHQDFFKLLKERCPELSSGELKLCALIKLNMNMKEAAAILGISPESVKTARYRLRKKFELSREESLVDYILNIGQQAEVYS